MCKLFNYSPKHTRFLDIIVHTSMNKAHTHTHQHDRAGGKLCIYTHAHNTNDSTNTFKLNGDFPKTRDILLRYTQKNKYTIYLSFHSNKLFS